MPGSSSRESENLHPGLSAATIQRVRKEIRLGRIQWMLDHADEEMARLYAEAEQVKRLNPYYAASLREAIANNLTTLGKELTNGKIHS